MIVALMTVNVATIYANTTESWLLEVSGIMVELEIYWPYPSRYSARFLDEESLSLWGRFSHFFGFGDDPRRSKKVLPLRDDIEAFSTTDKTQTEIDSIEVVFYTSPKTEVSQTRWWNDFPRHKTEKTFEELKSKAIPRIKRGNEDSLWGKVAKKIIDEPVTLEKLDSNMDSAERSKVVMQNAVNTLKKGLNKQAFLKGVSESKYNSKKNLKSLLKSESFQNKAVSFEKKTLDPKAALNNSMSRQASVKGQPLRNSIAKSIKASSRESLGSGSLLNLLKAASQDPHDRDDSEKLAEKKHLLGRRASNFNQSLTASLRKSKENLIRELREDNGAPDKDLMNKLDRLVNMVEWQNQSIGQLKMQMSVISHASGDLEALPEGNETSTSKDSLDRPDKMDNEYKMELDVDQSESISNDDKSNENGGSKQSVLSDSDDLNPVKRSKLNP